MTIPDYNFTYYINDTFAAQIGKLDPTYVQIAVGPNTVNGKIIETLVGYNNHYFYIDDTNFIEIKNYVLDGVSITGIPVVLDKHAWKETVEQALDIFEA